MHRRGKETTRSEKAGRLGANERAVSPAISTTILTSAVIVLILVTMVFANNYLNARLAENEFGAMKQFMQTVGLQIDNVAWILGSTQTIRYASKFGQVSFQPIFLNYSIYINGSPVANFSYVTRVLMFNMPTGTYNIGNDYYERITPSSDDSFLQWGIAAPVSHVYVIEKLPMYDGGYVRVVVVPCVRALNSTISTGSGLISNYTKMFLPILVPKSQTGNSQSVTLSGTRVSVKTQGVNSIRIVTSFPNASLGFDTGFFRFTNTTVTPTIPSGSIVEFYTGEVSTSLGL